MNADLKLNININEDEKEISVEIKFATSESKVVGAWKPVDEFHWDIALRAIDHYKTIKNSFTPISLVTTRDDITISHDPFTLYRDLKCDNEWELYIETEMKGYG